MAIEQAREEHGGFDGEEEKVEFVDPELAEDPNYKAYTDIEELLEGSYIGQWVAFTEGELVLVEPDKESLFSKIQKRFRGHSVFVKEIVEKEWVINLDIPIG